MVTTWSGSIALTEGQLARLYAEWALPTMDNSQVRVTIASPELVIDCYRMDNNFICEHADVEQMVSVCEVMHVVATGQRFSIDIGFKALATETATVDIEVVSANADVENVALTAEA